MCRRNSCTSAGRSPHEVARLRTEIHLGEDFDGHLAIGAGAVKRVRLDGVPVALDDGAISRWARCGPPPDLICSNWT